MIGADGAGNLISGNTAHGIAIGTEIASNNVVQGNLIGTDVTGLYGLGNGLFGVLISSAPNNLIGGLEEGAGNVIADNFAGVWVNQPGGNNNEIKGNLIGTDISGSAPLGNTRMGVRVQFVTGTVIDRNVISANGESGIHLSEPSSQTRIRGNVIGSDRMGILDLGNAQNGITIQGSASNIVGGTQPGDSNVISGNGGYGINIAETGASGNCLLGNYVGTNATTSDSLPNGLGGILLTANAHDNTIGGIEDGESNIISGNNGNGVTAISGTGNSIRGNSIYDNDGLGIDIGDDGPTDNDFLDSDIGANGLQNFPTISQADSGATTRAVGNLHSVADSDFLLDFYVNDEADPSGFGEGRRWLGSAMVTTDGAGNVDFDIELTGQTSSGQVITATATASDGSTSEFSGANIVAHPPVLIDIMPGSDLNPINLAQYGVIPVAIITTESFDASVVDASTVVFASADAFQSALEDVDGDGDLDMILHFRVQDTNLSEIYAQLLADSPDLNQQSVALSLNGKTIYDEVFAGIDAADLFLTGKALRELLGELAEAGLL